MSGNRAPQETAGEQLVHAAGGRMPDEPGGSVRAALANAMVGMKKQYYGRGPAGARAGPPADCVCGAREGAPPRNEETRLGDGKEAAARSYRLSFQETMGPTTMAAVEEITGRKVLTYHSQIAFDPVRAFE